MLQAILLTALMILIVYSLSLGVFAGLVTYYQFKRKVLPKLLESFYRGFCVETVSNVAQMPAAEDEQYELVPMYAITEENVKYIRETIK